MSLISIIDYGVGNLLSVARAFQHFGAEVQLINTPEQIAKADRLILPGVGAFADGMKNLEEQGFIEPVKAFAKTGKPFMGICLGMQMMLSQSTEFGVHSGLDIIPGTVEPIPEAGVDGKPHKIPHIGWNELVKTNAGGDWSETILATTTERSAAYFVHSFMVIPNDPAMRLANTCYDGQEITAVIKNGPIYGCQFHPEKSGEVGLKIIEQFLKV